MTNQRIFHNGITTGATTEAETVFSSGAHEYYPVVEFVLLNSCFPCSYLSMAVFFLLGILRFTASKR